MGERCGEMIRGGSGDAAVLERRREGTKREKETLISWLGKLAKLISYCESFSQSEQATSTGSSAIV